MTRTRLSNRRDSERATLMVDGQEFTAGVSFDEFARPKELFLDGPKEGSQMANVLRDIAVVISVAVQDGSKPKLLAKSVGREPDGKPTSFVGEALDYMVSLSPQPLERVACKGAREYTHT